MASKRQIWPVSTADSDSPWPTLYIDSLGGPETAGRGWKCQKTVFKKFFFNPFMGLNDNLENEKLTAEKDWVCYAFAMFCYVFGMFCYVLLCFAMFFLCFSYVFAMICSVLLCFCYAFAMFCYVLLCFAMCLLCFCYVLLCLNKARTQWQKTIRGHRSGKLGLAICKM